MEIAIGNQIGAALVALIFASVHLLSPRLVFLDRTPRSVWLSTAGGVSVAYVFVHLLPELAEFGELPGEGETEEGALEVWIYLLALTGLVVFYALERMAQRHAGHRSATESGAGAFWLHLAGFAIYNFLVGYLLEEQLREEGLGGMLLYALALGLHFVVNDRALYAHHGPRYLREGRWLLAVAVLFGFAASLGYEIPQGWIAGAFGFLAGSVVLNVIKEELPEERESRLWAFALGAGLYAALLILA
ncbi:hypothetical protein [Limimaricola soesokkakensis]|uniref:hypothetical protein n=1 Tax=Limimaricola soesokkakensis TaxID=1343159 RepID=UPI003517A287